ncbi:MAG TPA: DedA family protein [Pirellulales bacterium]|jgi:membrane-associated protein
MDLIKQFIDLFLHLDDHLKGVINDYGTWTYLILFGIIFCETGLVVMPILPGDSLLFAAGYFAKPQEDGISLNLFLLIALLIVAAVLGDAVNYAVGRYMGPKVLSRDGRFLKKKYLDRTHAFYQRYGGKTIILARFVPIVRTFAPFLAGVGTMSYFQFATYNVIGAILWVTSMTLCGYAFGGFQIVQERFELFVLAIVFISILPAIVEYLRSRSHKTPETPPAGG